MARRARSVRVDFMQGESVPQSLRVHGQDMQLRGVEVVWNVQYQRPPGVMAKALREWQKQAIREGLAEWHAKLLPAHFVEGAGSRYHYKRRTYGTRRMKIEKHGHNKPIVAEGISRQMLVRVPPVLSGTGQQGKARMRGPVYLGIIAKDKAGRPGPDLKKEITATDARDIRTIGANMQAFIANKARTYRRPERKVISG